MSRRLILAALGLVAATVSQARQVPDDRGAYLVNLAGCVHCHTAPEGDSFAGGLTLTTPFGDLLTPNITPDETGIKGWSLEDFKGALREGHKRDGAPLYPGMPYTAFTQITDEDIAAIWSYISDLEPVSNTVKVNQLPFPYNVRSAVEVWQAMFFDPGRFEPDPDASDQINRGAYIVEALAHCSSCHTPRNVLGGQIASQRYQGAKTENWYAPNISRGPDSVLSKWDDDDLASFLSNEHSLNIPAFGPMGQVASDLSKATPEDVAAIAAYILHGQPDPQDTDTARITPVADTEMTRGAEVFKANCRSCHSESGEGTPGVAASLVNNGGVIAAAPYNVINVLLQGIAPNDRYGVMPSFADELSNEEIAAVTNYVRRSWGNAGAEVAKPQLVAALGKSVGAPDPGVALGVLCRSVAESAVTPALASSLGAMARSGADPQTGQLADIAQDYAAAKPDLSRSERIVAMGALYCRSLAVARPDLGRPRFEAANIAFVDQLSEAVQDTAPVNP